MKNPVKADLLLYIQSICTDNISFDTKIATLSFSKEKHSSRFEALILFIEYAQLFSQSFLIISPLFLKTTSETNMLMVVLIPFNQLLTPGSLVQFGDNNRSAILIFSALIICMIIKFWLLIYIIVAALKDHKVLSPLARLWKLIFKLHGKVLYYLFTSFWMALALAASGENLQFVGLNGNILMAFSIGVTITEYLFSLFLYVRYDYLLPTKSFLSSKNNIREIVNITIKFIIQMLQLVPSPSGNWLVSLLFLIPNLFANLFLCKHYFTTFPLYNFKALFLEGSFLLIVTWANLSYLLCSTIEFLVEINTSMEHIMIIWLIIVPFVVKMSTAYIQKLITSLITEHKDKSAELLIHKINAVKEFRSAQRPFTEHSERFGKAYLLHKTYSARTNVVFHLKTENNKNTKMVDLNHKDLANKIFSTYLESLSVRFPKNGLVKLYLAYYYGKKMKLYGVAIRNLFALQQSFSVKVKLTACLLISEIQAKLKEEYNSSESELDLSTYINNLSNITELKIKILEQADLQIKVCKELSEDVPDLAKIFDVSQSVVIHKKQIEKKIKESFITLPEHNIEPYMLVARYHLALNHSLIDYTNFYKTFKNLFEKHAKYSKKNRLCQENIYDSNTGFILITAQTGTTGTINYCTKSVENIYGISLVGCPAYIIAPPILQNFYFEFFRNPLDQANQALIGRVLRTFAYHKHGHLIEIDFYLNIHPFLSQGLYYNLIIHPIRSSKDFLILNEQGSIEGFTKKVGEKLGLLFFQESNTTLSINIQQLSNDLARLSQACNIITGLNKKNLIIRNRSHRSEHEEIIEDIEINNQDLNIEEAKTIYSAFNSEGKILKLASLKSKKVSQPDSLNQDENYTYHCKIDHQFYGSILIKVITLDQVETNEIGNELEFEQLIREPAVNSLENKEIVLPKEIVIMNEIKDDKQIHILPLQEGQKESAKRKISPNVAAVNGDIEQEAHNNSGFSSADINHIPMELVVKEYKKDVSSNFLGVTEYQLSTKNDPSVRKLVQRSKEIKFSNMKNTDSKSQKFLSNEKESLIVKLNQDERDDVEKLEKVQQSLGSHKSKSSAQAKVSKALKEAMSVRYYPKFYNPFMLIFYLLIIGVFVAQLNLKLVLDNYLSDRKSGKDVMRSAEIRNDLIIGVQRQLMLTWDISTGRLKDNELGLFSQPLSSFIAAISKDLVKLASTNDDLIDATNSLASEYRQKLFERNVRVYETAFEDFPQLYVSLNNFQATDRIIETTFKALSLISNNTEAAKPYFNFIFRNVLNDLLVKSQEITEIFIRDLNLGSQIILNNFVWILTSTMLIIALLFIITTTVIISQYNTEKRNMLALIRLNEIHVKNFLARLIRFKNTVQEDRHLEEVTNLDVTRYTKLVSTKTGTGSKKVNKGYMKNSNYNGLFMKYCKHLLKLLLVVLILGSFMVLNYTFATDIINSLQRKLQQLYFSDQLRSRLNLALITSQILVTNDTVPLVKNQPVKSQIKFALEDVKSIRMEIPYAFTDDVSIGDPLIEEIVFSDGCKYMQDFAAKGCEAHTKGAQKMSLLNAAADLELGVTERLDLYVLSDKSPQALKKIQLSTLNASLNPNIIIGGESTLISNRINTSYEEDLSQAKLNNGILWGGFCGIILILSMFAWFGLLSRIRRADKEFKNVLQTFPINLILSNFMLKNYLLKTSKGTLEFIKNQI